MNAKSRIKRAEAAIKPRDQLEFIWVEQDENGNNPPAPPGTKVIDVKWEYETQAIEPESK